MVRAMQPVTRRECIAVALIFLAALALRLLHLAELQTNDPFFELPAVDAGMYHAWAQRIADGDWLGERIFVNGPAYPYLLALVYSVFGPSLLAAKALQATLGALDCVLVWWLARRLFDARVGLVAAALVAGYGMLLFYEGTLVVANLQLTLTLLTLWLVLRAFESPSAGRWWLAGAIVGLASLARPTALLFGALVAGGVLLGVRRELGVASRVGFAAIFAAGVVLAVAPVTLRNAAVGDDFVLVTSSGGMNLYTGNNPSANGMFQVPRIFPQFLADDPWEQPAMFHKAAEQVSGRELRPSEASRFWRGQALEWIRENPGAWWRLSLRKLRLSVNVAEPWNIRSLTLSRDFSWVLRLPLLGFGVLAPLALAGIAFSGRDWRRLYPLYAMLGSIWAALLVFFVISRYRLPAVPVLAIFAGFTCVHAFDAMNERRWPRLALLAACIAGAAVVVNVRAVGEDLSVAYYNLGNRYKTLEQWELAIDAYDKAIARNPRYLSAHNNLALVYEATGEHDEQAIRSWRHILETARRRNLERYIERATRHLRTLGAPVEVP